MTDLQAFILAALKELRRAHGLAIGEYIERRTKPVGIGALYKALHSLERKEQITSEWEDQRPDDLGRPRRRYYQLTAFGSKALTEFITSEASKVRTLRRSAGAIDA